MPAPHRSGEALHPREPAPSAPGGRRPARTRASSAHAISSTGGVSASVLPSRPAGPTSGQCKPKANSGLLAPPSRRMLWTASAYRAPCFPVRAYAPRRWTGPRRARPGAATAGGLASGALDAVSVALLAVATFAARRGFTLSAPGPGAVSGVVERAWGPGRSQGRPPSRGRYPPVWPSAAGASRAVTSSANAAIEHIDPPERVNSIGVSARTELQRTRSALRAAPRFGVLTLAVARPDVPAVPSRPKPVVRSPVRSASLQSSLGWLGPALRILRPPRIIWTL